jgi:hypothetical protein
VAVVVVVVSFAVAGAVAGGVAATVVVVASAGDSLFRLPTSGQPPVSTLKL